MLYSLYWKNGMGKFEDMALLVEIVRAGSLAAAGRRVNLSPAAMTSRLANMEKRYQTRLFNRTTREMALTRIGEEYYQAALRVIDEMNRADSALTQTGGELNGSLRIGSPSDFARQYLSRAISDFCSLHPQVKISLYIAEEVVNLIAWQLDMSIRFGNLPDSNLVTRAINHNHRVLVAAPEYLHHAPPLQVPGDLQHHRCLVMERERLGMTTWKFRVNNQKISVQVPPAMVCNDGAILRQWALDGAGIACKSWWDVKNDIASGRLTVLFAESFLGFSDSDNESVGLQFVYPEGVLMPVIVRSFSDFFISWLETQ